MTTWQPTACILCSENCGLEVKVEGEHIAAIRGDKAHPESRGYLCQKAGRLDHYQNHDDRITQPLKRQPDGSFVPVTWEVAIAEIAARMTAIKAQHGGRAFAYYGGGGQGNHLGGVYSGALRAALGTPFVYTALAQEKTGDFWVNGELFGRQTCHVSADVEHADVVLFLGTNPWQSHGFPRARVVLKELAKDPARTMIVVDPRRTETAAMADLHLQVRPGGDAFLLGAMLGHLVQSDLHDREFLKARCEGAEPVLDALRAIDVDAWASRAGVAVADVRRAAELLGRARSATVRADLGIQQSRNSTLNSYLEKLLFLLTGNLGKSGGNHFHTYLLPLIGHSGEPSEAERTAVSSMFPISKLYPPNILPGEILADHPDRVRAVIVDSANPLVSGADTAAYEAAFAALDLAVVIDVALTETARAAHYVLPAASQFEKAEATFFNLGFPDNGFHLRRALFAPRGGALPEPEIYRRLCVALGALPDRFPVLERAARLDRRYKALRLFPMALKAHLALHPKQAGLAALVLYATLGKALPPGLDAAAVLWAGCHRYVEKNAAAVARAGVVDAGAGLGEALFDRVLAGASGVVLSSHVHEDTWSFIRHADGRVHLHIPRLLSELRALDATPEGSRDLPFLLMAGERRSYNANTALRDPRWRKDDPAGALRMHPMDAAGLGVADGAAVTVRSARGEVVAVVALTDALQRGVVSMPHGYGMDHPDADGRRTTSGPRINRLTAADHCDPWTKTPLHKAVPVAIEVVRERGASS